MVFANLGCVMTSDSPQKSTASEVISKAMVFFSARDGANCSTVLVTRGMVYPLVMTYIAIENCL